MEILSISDLMYLTHDELCDLSQRIERGLIELEAGSVARTNTLTSIANIRRVMLARGFFY